MYKAGTRRNAPATPDTAGKDIGMAQKAAGAHFIGHWKQGTIELMGVSNYPPTKQSQWWKPDGSATKLGPFLPQPTKWSLSADKKPLAFLLRIQNLPAGASWPAWNIEPNTGRWGSTGVLDDHGKSARDYLIFCAELGTGAEMAKFRVGIDYQWVKFKNISLQPGYKTDVKVISPGASIARQRTDCQRRNLIAADRGGGRW